MVFPGQAKLKSQDQNRTRGTPLQQMDRAFVCIIPANGEGTRFRNTNNAVPKPLIRFLGTEMIFWLLDDIVKHLDSGIKYIVIPYNACMNAFGFSERIRERYPACAEKIKCLPLHYQTNGATETVAEGIRHLMMFDPSVATCPLLCLDSDTFYTPCVDVCRAFIDQVKYTAKGGVFVFNASSLSTHNTPYSHCVVKTVSREIEDISEKQRISNWACTGAYGFPSCSRTLASAKRALLGSKKEGRHVNGECYLSHLVKLMISEEIDSFVAIPLEQNQLICLGTPMHILKESMMQALPCPKMTTMKVVWRHHVISTTRYGQLALERCRCSSEPSLKNDIKSLCGFLSRMKASHQLCVDVKIRATSVDTFMRLHKSSPADLYSFKNYVVKQLNDMLLVEYNGSVRARLPLVDNVITTCSDDAHDDINDDTISLLSPGDYAKQVPISLNIHTDTGFISGSHSPCRHFHDVIMNDAENTVVKTARGEAAQVHLANQARFLIEAESQPWAAHFPKLLSPCHDDVLRSDRLESYTMRQVSGGVTLSFLFCHHMLDTDTFRAALAVLTGMHAHRRQPEMQTSIPSMYDNYSMKMQKRLVDNRLLYEEIIVQEDDHSMLSECMAFLSDYEKNDQGILGYIHGDPVFSNIMLENQGHCVFIDPRAQLGHHMYSPIGDILYDYAKVLQSTLGYDEVLCATQVPSAYRAQFINCLYEHVRNTCGESYVWRVKMLCLSLFLSLLPFHNDREHQHAFMRIARHLWGICH